MAELEVRLLGVPTFQRGGAHVRFDTRKAVALLALLAVSRRDWAREELAALLWPESANTRARGSLRRTLVTAARVGPALRSERSRVGLDLSMVWCDVTQFQAWAGDALPPTDDSAERLWRGDFLAGFTLRDSPDFEDWSDDHRSSLRRDRDTILSRLADRLAAEGRYDLALQHSQNRLTIDRLHEPAYRQLMTVLAAAGDRSAALKQYRHCVRVLDRELGVPPLPETTDLYEAIRRNETVAAAPPNVSSAARDSETSAGDRGRPGGREQPFVGREQELARLAAAWSSAAEVPQVVGIVGDTGMGKTHLVEQLVEAQGIPRVVRVKGHEGEQRLAFGAAAELVRSLAELDDDPVGGLGQSEPARLASLVPGIAGHQSPGEPLDSPGALTRLYESVRTLLSAVARQQRCLVWLDDLEWFDAESAELAMFLLRRPPVDTCFVVSWRAGDQPTAVVEAMGDALADGYGEMIRLSALTREEAAELTRQLGGPVDASIDQLVLRTGGVPLLVVEHALAVAGGSSPSSPVTVEGAVAARLDRAPASTRQVLAAVAVLATTADAEMLQQVSGRSELEVADALDDAVQRRLLSAAESGLEYDFPHDSLRRVVTERTALARRRLLHARAADALLPRRDRHPESVSAAVLARLMEGAGRLDDAGRWYALAADEAREMYAHATAVAHLERAIALGADPVQSHLSLGEANVRLGHYTVALTDYETVVAVAEDPADMAAAEHKLAEVYDRLGDWQLALDHLEAALALADVAVDGPTTGHLSQLRASVLADVALVSLRLDRLEVGQEAADRARGLAETVDAGAALAQALNVLAVLSHRRGDTPDARALFDLSQQCAESLGDPGPLVAVLNNRARFEAEQGSGADAVDLATQALALGTRHGDRHRLAALHANLADALHHSGREDEAREHLVQSAALFAEVDREPDRRPEVWKLVEW